MIKVCHNCGIEYAVSKSQESRSKFCSDKCFRESRNTQVIYNCDYCGKEFSVRKSKVINKQKGILKHLCCSSDCAKNIQKPKWEDICKLFCDKGYILKSTCYKGCKDKLEYICLKHIDKGSQFITFNNIKHGCGCKYCGREKIANARRLSFDDAKKIFANNDMELVDGQTYNNTSELMAYICINHREYGIQHMTTSNAYRNHCPHCRKSKGERVIANFLTLNKINFIPQYKFDDLLGVRGKPLSYDFYLPNHNILIEYQGEFHDGSVNGMQTAEELHIQQEHDQRKRDYSIKHNIKMVEIWYYDFPKIEDILNQNLYNT